MGGFNPSPLKTGAERGHLQEALVNGLVEADGTALDGDSGSYNYAEHLAESRCLAYLWDLNTRLGNQWDPLRVTDFLSRWETILGILPPAGATDVSRRAAISAKEAAGGQPGTAQVAGDLLRQVLGPIFLALVNTSSSQALGFVAGGVSVPGGVTLPDGGTVTWSSTIANVMVQVQEPTGTQDAALYSAVAQIPSFLDGLLPAWVTFDWFRNGASGTGFVLDDAFNLDNEAFDS